MIDNDNLQTPIRNREMARLTIRDIRLGSDQGSRSIFHLLYRTNMHPPVPLIRIFGKGIKTEVRMKIEVAVKFGFRNRGKIPVRKTVIIRVNTNTPGLANGQDGPGP